jgi:hypothetical protein
MSVTSQSCGRELERVGRIIYATNMLNSSYVLNLTLQIS